MSEAAVAHAACRNCGTALQPSYEFCPHCGQETHDEPPRFLEFVHEFITHYVALEGRLWKSLWLLTVRPGQLTLEYLAGRKNSYVWPLRLFLTLSFVFFLSLKFSGGAEPLANSPGVSVSAGAAASAASTPASALQRGEIKLDLPDLGSLPGPLERGLQRFAQRVQIDPAEEFKRVGRTFMASLPTLVLLFQPLFAGLLALVYRSRRMNYGAHFVFALHLHAFWYLCLWLALWLPDGVPSLVLWAWSNLYALLALKRVYGGSWRGTLGRAAGLAGLHWLGLGLLLLGELAYLAMA